MSGELKQGADAKVAAAVVSNLLRVAVERVPQLLVGKPVAVRREMPLDQAEALRDRLAAVGIPATVEPVAELGLELAPNEASSAEEKPKTAKTPGRPIESSLELESQAPSDAPKPDQLEPSPKAEAGTGGSDSLGAGLELEPQARPDEPEPPASGPEQEAGSSKSDGSESRVDEIEAVPFGGFANSNGEVRIVTPAPNKPVIDKEGPSDEDESAGEDDDAGHEQFFDPRMTRNWHDIADAAEAAPRKGRTKSKTKSKTKPSAVPLLAVAGVAVLALLGAGAFFWLGGGEKAPVAEAPPEVQPAPVQVSPAEQRLAGVARAVKLWMIQYGVGYDPTQVTIERLKRDGVIDEDRLKDPWGTEMRYEPGKDGFRVLSAGADRAFGTGDDRSVIGNL